MARHPTLVQLTNDLLVLLDRRAEVTGSSRSELIRTAVATYLAEDREAALDAQIVRGYEEIPETADAMAWAEYAIRESIAGEPW